MAKTYNQLRKWIDDWGYPLTFAIFDENDLYTIDLTNATQAIIKISRYGMTTPLLEVNAEFKDRVNGIIQYKVKETDFPLSKFESTTTPVPKPWIFNVWATIYFHDNKITHYITKIRFDKAG